MLWCASIRRQHQIPQPGLRVGVDVIVPSASVRDLGIYGIYLDCDVSMRTHVSEVVSSCFAVLRRLRSIRSSVTRPVFVSLVVSMVLSRLDYGNATLAGITVRLMDRFRSVLNASARLIYASRRTEHVTPLLRGLHWLRYPDRIDYKLAVLVFRCLHGLAPSYLADEFTSVSEIESPRRASFSAKDTRWSCFPCGSGSSMEQPTVTCHIIIIVGVIQTQSQDWAVPEIVRLSLISASAPRQLYDFVTCPWSQHWFTSR